MINPYRTIQCWMCWTRRLFLFAVHEHSCGADGWNYWSDFTNVLVVFLSGSFVLCQLNQVVHFLLRVSIIWLNFSPHIQTILMFRCCLYKRRLYAVWVNAAMHVQRCLIAPHDCDGDVELWFYYLCSAVPIYRFKIVWLAVVDIQYNANLCVSQFSTSSVVDVSLEPQLLFHSDKPKTTKSSFIFRQLYSIS